MTIESTPRPGPAGSWLGRVLATPLSDLARGRVLPALDARDIIAQAALPADVAAAAHELLDGLRLPLAPRAEAAAALAAHLRCRLAAQVPAAALITELPRDQADLARLRRAVCFGGGAVLTVPPALRDLVLRVARRVDLWRRERLDVVAELCGHFRDGLDAGASVPDLLGAFGDARSAARLIRRAKLRGRPLGWQAWRVARNVAGGALVAAVVLYAGLAIWAYSQKPTLSRNFLAELNAPIRAIPPEQRAWPLYREAYLATCPWPTYVALTEPPLREFAAENERVLRLYRDGAARPRLGASLSTNPDDALWPLRRGIAAAPAPPSSAERAAEDGNPSMIGVLMPYLSVVREGARLLWIDGYWAAQAGDGPRLVADVRAMLRMAEHAADPPTVIADLVRLAIVAQAAELVGVVLRDAPQHLSEGDLVQLAHALGGSGGGGPLRIDLSADRTVIADTIQRVYSDDGRGDGRLTPQGLAMLLSVEAAPREEPIALPSARAVVAPAASLLAPSRAELWGEYEALIERHCNEAAQPLWERRSSEAEKRFESLTHSRFQKVRYLLLTLLMPSLTRASLMGEFATLRRDAALAALAAFAYEKRTGRWPASLKALVPQYLPAVPLDRFDGQVLRYRIVGDRPLIYSVGADFVDNGGTRPRGGGGELHTRLWRPLDKRAEPPQSPDWKKIEGTDWVLWPPE